MYAQDDNDSSGPRCSWLYDSADKRGVMDLLGSRLALAIETYQDSDTESGIHWVRKSASYFFWTLNESTYSTLSMMALYTVDSWYFQKSTFTPLNFLVTNLSSVSSFYGLNEWHYYLSQGLPILINAYLPFFVLGSWSVMKYGLIHQKSLVRLVLWTITIYSLLGHKEWRFLHPILPISLIICSKAIVDSGTRMEMGKDVYHIKKRSVRKTLLWSLTTGVSVLLGCYVMYFHGRAQINVMSYLRSLDETELKSVGVLMPCHSTPWQSHLHKSYLSGNGFFWALGCEPPLQYAQYLCSFTWIY